MAQYEAHDDHAVTFGAFVRRKRLARGIGLREMAKMIGVSPTYLSKIERGEFAPPAEDKVKAIALAIGCSPDVLMARAGRVPRDVMEWLAKRPDMVMHLRNLRAKEMMDGQR